MSHVIKNNKFVLTYVCELFCCSRVLSDNVSWHYFFDKQNQFMQTKQIDTETETILFCFKEIDYTQLDWIAHVYVFHHYKNEHVMGNA